MNDIKVEGFAEDSSMGLAEKIEKYAKDNKLIIKQISAYCNVKMMYSERAIVVFEKAR